VGCLNLTPCFVTIYTFWHRIPSQLQRLLCLLVFSGRAPWALARSFLLSCCSRDGFKRVLLRLDRRRRMSFYLRRQRRLATDIPSIWPKLRLPPFSMNSKITFEGQTKDAKRDTGVTLRRDTEGETQKRDRKSKADIPE
jgi:hypothetical protein